MNKRITSPDNTSLPFRSKLDRLSKPKVGAALAMSTMALVASGIVVNGNQDRATDLDVQVELIDEISNDTASDIAPPPPVEPGKIQASTLIIGTYNEWYKKRDAQKSINDTLNILRGTANTPPVAVLGIQEFKGDDEPTEFKKQVPLCDTCEFDAYIPDSEASAMPIVWKPAEVTALSKESIPLHPKVEADGVGVASKWLNIVLFQDKVTGQQFYHVNFHLVYGIQKGDELNEENPERVGLVDLELGGIVPKVAELILTGLPIVATFDGNWSASSDSMYSPKNILLDLGFIDSHDAQFIDNTPQEQGTHGNRDIDYVLIHPGMFDTQLQILMTWTLGDSLIELTSDHDAFESQIAILRAA